MATPRVPPRCIPGNDSMPGIKVFRGDTDWVIKVLRHRPNLAQNNWDHTEAPISIRFNANKTGIQKFASDDPSEPTHVVDMPGGETENFFAAMHEALKISTRLMLTE